MKLLDFTNETEHFHVRSITLDGVPYFVGKDICDALQLTNSNKTLGRLDPEDRMVLKVDIGVTSSYPKNTQGGTSRDAVCVNESGLYSLILTSRKPSARRFKRWVTGEVLPAIREHGYYSVFGSEEDAAKAKLAGRVAGQMSTIRRSVENLREPLPYNYGSIHALLRSFGIELGTPGQRLTLYRACKAKAAEHHARVIPVWNPESWRGVSCYPREIVRAALLETGHAVEPDLFDNLLAN